MTRIGVLSDTHGFLPQQAESFFKNCDEIWHPGDIGDESVLTGLAKIAKTRAVFGNIDGQHIRAITEKFLFFKIESKKILLTHIAGVPYKYSYEANELIKIYSPDILVCGHSHILLVQYNKKDKLLHINPGAAGNNGFHKKQTLLRFEIDKENIQNMEIWEKERR